MKELVILSGKGGTGKTSITAAFASLAKSRILCDADVDAADLHLLMAPKVLQAEDFSGGGEAIVQEDLCTQCGTCAEVCRFEAVREGFTIDPIACEGCGVCVDFCPEKAILFPEKTRGQWFISDTRFGPMVHARLGIAEENSGKLVALVRRQAEELAREKGLDMILTDGPPGIGCPVIASLGGASAVLIVAEPTISGLHDMERVAELAGHFKIPAMLCVNKYDLNPDQAEKIIKRAREKGISVLGKILFDPAFTESMMEGKALLEYRPETPAVRQVKGIWEKVMASLP